MTERISSRTWFAIIHTPTGKLLPSPPSGYRAGGTWVTLHDQTPPRLFRTEAAAKICLQHWLKGRRERVWPDDSFDLEEREPRPYMRTTPDPTRIRSEMAVIQVTLVQVDAPLPLPEKKEEASSCSPL